ncbi:MAG: ribulose-phosphate 3-epimerase [Pseudomonadota bacterium]|jgi:ribulose-phosphate 3-epimerase
MSSKRIIVSPSILSADFTRLGEELEAVQDAGADWIHVDVMDGRFVPNISIGPMVVEAVKKVARVPLDVHLMIADPDSYIEAFRDAGADILHVHPEAGGHLHRTLNQIRKLDMKAGAALNPATGLEAVKHVLQDLDVVMIMTVNPGFGGQSFIHTMLPKIAELRRMIDESGLDILIEIDGGVNPTTARDLVLNGADVFVAGSAVFGRPPYKEVIDKLRYPLG